MDDNGEEEREVVTIAGISERKQAYAQAVQQSKQVEKTKVPVFKVEDGILDESYSHHDGSFSHNEGSFSHNDGSLDDFHGVEQAAAEENDDESLVADDEIQATVQGPMSNSMNDLRPSGFFGASSSNMQYDEGESSQPRIFGATYDELGLDPEKSKEVLQEEESAARSRFARLLAQFEPSFSFVEDEEEQDAVTVQSFDVVQKRYLEAVEKLRPQKFSPEKYEGPAESAFSSLKEDYEQEQSKKQNFGDLQDRWYDYDGAAQDNRWHDWCVTAQDLPDLPSRTATESENEHQIDDKEDEITSQWIDFTEMVVETAEKIKAESDDDLSVDEDVSRWREEARRLKADAALRRKRKEAMLERRRKRRENAVKRHEEFVYKGDGGSRRREQDADARRENVSNSRRRESFRRRGEESEPEEEEDGDNGPSDSSDSSDSEEEDTTTQPATDPAKITEAKKAPVVEKKEPEKKKEKDRKKRDVKHKKEHHTKPKEHTKPKKKDKKEKDHEPPASPKKIKPTASKAPSSSSSPTHPCGNDDDMTDGPEEKNPRHLDNTLWKNLLKFWTNKPKKLNETGAKYILKTLPRTDCFRRTERSGNDNASFYWFKTEGDFDVIVKIKGNFRSSYDKAGIMLREDEKTWVLSGIEHFNGQLNHSTCITRGVSDWSLSPVPEEARDGLWICVKRSGGKVECYFSMDLRKWVQTRQGLFTTAQTLKVGVAAACPMGEPFKVVFERFRVQKR